MTEVQKENPVEKQEGPQPGTPEYDAAMAAKFDQATGEAPQEQPAKSERPAHIPEKFWDAENGQVRVEELAKSYAELEKAKGKPQEQPKEDKPAENKEQSEAEKALADKGLDYNSFTQEFQETGNLSEDSYAKLEKAGIPKEYVDAYIAGQTALAAQRESSGYELVGGKDKYQEMTVWAAQNLSQEEKVAFNEAVNGNEAQMKLAISGLKERFEQANGKKPGLLGGNTTPSGSNGYQSRAQMTADMRNPLYKKDPAFRAQVEAKVAASDFNSF